MSEPLRALHLYANYKWTGPADPAIRCAASLRQAGVDLAFAQAAWTLPGAEHRMAKELSRGNMPVVAGLELRRHFRPWSVWRDARFLCDRLDRGDFNLLHCHQVGDHLIAAMARRRTRRPVALVRSVYDADAPDRGWRQRLSFGRSDGVVVPGPGCAEQMQSRFGLPADRVLVQEPPVNVDRFDHLKGDLRQKLGLAEDHVAIGITARIQPHRRFPLLWEVARLVIDQCPDARFVLLGRGNEKDTREQVLEPVRRLGLEQQVILPGYLYEPEYSLAIRSLQVFMFLVPGSDGTCRAVREAMAAGLPVLASKRGMLPELVGRRHYGEAREPCGLLYDERPDLMAEGLVRLIKRPDLRQSLGTSARERAVKTMDQRAAARRLLEFYDWLRSNPR